MRLRSEIVVLRALNVLVYKAIYPDAPRGAGGSSRTEKHWQDLVKAIANRISWLEGEESRETR